MPKKDDFISQLNNFDRDKKTKPEKKANPYELKQAMKIKEAVPKQDMSMKNLEIKKTTGMVDEVNAFKAEQIKRVTGRD